MRSRSPYLYVLLLMFVVTLPAWGDCTWNPNGTTSTTLPIDCKVGIGMTGPATVYVYRTSTADTYDLMTQCTGTNCVSRIGVAGPGAQQSIELDAATDTSMLQTGKTGPNRLAIVASPIMLVAGNVGIGWGYLATPAATLDVNGTLRVTGAITGGSVIGATYQDVAEWVPSQQRLAPGTVVVINPALKNGVIPSGRAYDTRVAGVVSENPGVILGVAANDKSQIATTGRVHVHADATNHPIATGDLLVTGEKPGVAMRSDPVDLGGVKIHRPGTIIGKALESLPEGEGEILVLLSLQ